MSHMSLQISLNRFRIEIQRLSETAVDLCLDIILFDIDDIRPSICI
jgi:uncharacterized protein with PhoU and TrkA domain